MEKQRVDAWGNKIKDRRTGLCFQVPQKVMKADWFKKLVTILKGEGYSVISYDARMSCPKCGGKLYLVEGVLSCCKCEYWRRQ